MCAKKLVVALGIAALGLAAMTGCFIPQTVGEEFQGGSSPAQAISKFIANQWDTMNPDDIQMLPLVGDQLGVVPEDAEIPDITDEQAAAVVDFIAANDIVTLEDMERVLEQAADDPTSVEIPDSVKDVLGSLLADQELGDAEADALEQVLNS